MQADEVRFLFAYDRWATRRVLTVLDGLDPAVWTRTHVVDERGLGGILVHHLGASQRWRHGFQDTGESPEPEDDPLPTIGQLHERWEAEWAAVDAWLSTLTDDFVAHVHEGVPVWQMLVHVVNHGTQHRAEAAALLTAEGQSPGELDLINYAEEEAEALPRQRREHRVVRRHAMIDRGTVVLGVATSSGYPPVRLEREHVSRLTVEDIADRRERREPDRASPAVLEHGEVHDRDAGAFRELRQGHPAIFEYTIQMHGDPVVGLRVGLRSWHRRPRAAGHRTRTPPRARTD